MTNSQPNEFRWCIPHANAQWLAGRFFWRPGSVGMHFDRGAIQAYVLAVDRQNLLLLQPGEDQVQHPRFTPAINPRVDRMPTAKLLGQPTPFATMLHQVEESIEQLQIAHTHVPALPRQAIGDPLILTLSKLHIPTLPKTPSMYK